MRRLLQVAVACTAIAMATPAAAQGVELAPGDIIAVFFTDQPPNRDLVRVDPVTGDTTTISSGGLLQQPGGIEVEPDGDILVAAFGTGLPNDPGGVIRVDPLTGAQTRLSSGELFVHPTDIALEADGDILVVAEPAELGRPALFRLNPVTGAETIVSSGGSFVTPHGVAVEPDGDILVVDLEAFDDPDSEPQFRFPGGVIRVDPVTGAQTTVSSGGLFSDPIGIAVEADGNILVADRFAGLGTPPFFFGGLIRVDPATGAQTTLSSLGTGDDLTNPTAVAVEADGNIIAATGSTLHRVDPVTGAASFLAGVGHNGVAVVPPLSPRLPTSIRDCLNGGWRDFGFRNVGGCISFVVLTRICEALERKGHHPPFCPPAPPRRS
jgi:sugar lactone lactonase YvrE